MDQNQVAGNLDMQAGAQVDGPLLPSMADELDARVADVPREADARYWFRQGVEWAAMWVVRHRVLSAQQEVAAHD